MRRQSLDGLRGIAVLAVVAYHFSFGNIPGGFLGVELFFALSGFLITTMLVEERRATLSVSLGNFYMRRVLRLAPALVIAILLCDAIILTVRDNLITPGLSIVATNAAVLFYVANWMMIPSLGGLGALDHAWSLSVEEQFYLVWPAVLLVLFARARWPWRWALGLGLLAQLLTMILLLVTPAPGLLYFASSTHATALLLGCSAALWPRARILASGRVAVVAGLLLLAMVLSVKPTDPWMYEGGFLLAALACTVLVTHCATSASPLASLLSFSPLVTVGRISYGLYLYHFPIFLIAWHFVLPHNHLRLVLLIASGLLATFVVAAVSYVVVEKPALRLKERWRSPRRHCARSRRS